MEDISIRQDIVCGGMYRSGTTLVYNMVCDMIENQTQVEPVFTPTGKRFGNIYLHKIHEDTPDYITRSLVGKIKVIYNYRNILDCLVSMCQKNNLAYKNFNLHGRDPLEFIRWMINLDNQVCASKGKFLEIRYESQITQIDTLHIELGNFLGIDPDIDISKYEFSKVKEKTDSLNTLDRRSNFWPNHLADGKVGKYMDFLEDSQIKSIYSNTEYVDWAKRRQYIK